MGFTIDARGAAGLWLRFWVQDATPDQLEKLTALLDMFFEEGKKHERKACADLAWKLQSEQFGGGTAIGNAIQDRKDSK